MIRPLHTMLAVVILVAIVLGWIVLTWPSEGQTLQTSPELNSEYFQLTGTTAQISAENHILNAVAYSQTIYPADQWKDRPAAVVLVRDDDIATAITTTRLQHFPVNAPMLYVTDAGTTLPIATKLEMKRLGPEGVMMDNNVKVYLVGDIDPSVEREVERMGFPSRAIRGENVLKTSDELDKFLAVLDSDAIGFVLIGSTAAPEFALSAGNWNAHMGGGFAWVTPEGIPPETKKILERRGPNYPFIYVFAPESVVPQEVLASLTEYGHVERIGGDTVQEMAIEWASYGDKGRLLGWWFGQSDRSVGWGIDIPGHNVILANPIDWRFITPSGVLSHMGKHAPLVLTGYNGELAEVTREYLLGLKPFKSHPSRQVFNFGWVIGNDISEDTMRELSELLSVSE